MDQEKIGKFIAEMRKQKNMTQQDLADKLKVSNKTIGNWENGRNMPDLSLFKPLCNELGITADELILGEKIGNDSKKKEKAKNLIVDFFFETIEEDEFESKTIETENIIVDVLVIIGFFITMCLFPKDEVGVPALLFAPLAFIVLSPFLIYKKVRNLSIGKKILLVLLYFALVFVAGIIFM